MSAYPDGGAEAVVDGDAGFDVFDMSMPGMASGFAFVDPDCSVAWTWRAVPTITAPIKTIARRLAFLFVAMRVLRYSVRVVSTAGRTPAGACVPSASRGTPGSASS